jgi:prevent-host-death family protein
MREQEPTTQVMNASQARRDWSEVLNRVFRGNTRVVVEKSGIPIAAIISPQELERFNRLDAQRKAAYRALDETRAAFESAAPEEIEREVATAIRQDRDERRRDRDAAKSA